MLKTLERLLKHKIDMYEAFIASRKAFNMPTEEFIYRKQECESWLITVQQAIKGFDVTK
jgi:hypothetical protein